MCNKLSRYLNNFIGSGHITLILHYCGHLIIPIKTRVEVNYGYVTVLLKKSMGVHFSVTSSQSTINKIE